MRQLVVRGFLLCLLVLCWPGTATLADGEYQAAGLVIVHGNGDKTFAVVPFESSSISGVELLQRSGVDLVTVSFGALGDGVCMIDDEGCPVGDCRKRLCQTGDPESPYWRYFQLSDGSWAGMALGASGSKVVDGGVDAWSWSPVEANVEPLSFQQIASLAGVPETGKIDRVYLRQVDSDGNQIEPQDEDSGPDNRALVVVAVIAVMALLIAASAHWRRRND